MMIHSFVLSQLICMIAIAVVDCLADVLLNANEDLNADQGRARPSQSVTPLSRR